MEGEKATKNKKFKIGEKTTKQGKKLTQLVRRKTGKSRTGSETKIS
jgi:hypothetical protein